MKRLLLCVVIIVIAITIAGCAAGPNTLAGTPNDDGHIAGFWLGLWHGMIFLLAFIFSLFDHNVQFYEVHNSGIMYNLGFILGLLSTVGGGGAASRRKS